LIVFKGAEFWLKRIKIQFLSLHWDTLAQKTCLMLPFFLSIFI